MDVQWSNLGEVSLASLAITVAVIVMFALGIVVRARGRQSRAVAPGSGRERVAAGAAVLCFAACLAVAAYGIYLIVIG
jgi:hypothetical protein